MLYLLVSIEVCQMVLQGAPGWKVDFGCPASIFRILMILIRFHSFCAARSAF